MGIIFTKVKTHNNPFLSPSHRHKILSKKEEARKKVYVPVTYILLLDVYISPYAQNTYY